MANEPYGVVYPVAFHAGGDTTRDAFRKHIKEIEEIYAKLNGLNSSKLESTTLTDAMKAHIDDANPHPNYKPSLPSLGELSGSIDASRVTGTLTQAKIPKENVNGLESYVKGLIPAVPDTGEGITSYNLSSSGMVKFKNGLIVKWGNSGAIFKEGQAGRFKYAERFPSNCFSVQLTYIASSDGYEDAWCQLLKYDAEGFECFRQADNYNTGASGTASVNYLSIGV